MIVDWSLYDRYLAHLIDPNGEANAPAEVALALLDLVPDPTAIEASFVEKIDVDRSTTWSGWWATQTHLVHVKASKPTDGWSGSYPEDGHAASVVAWRVRLDRVVSVSIVDLDYRKLHFGEVRHSWTSAYEINLADGMSHPVPANGKAPSNQQSEERLRKLIDWL